MPFRLPFSSRSPSGSGAGASSQQPTAAESGRGSPGGPSSSASSTVPLPPVSPTKASSSSSSSSSSPATQPPPDRTQTAHARPPDAAGASRVAAADQALAQPAAAAASAQGLGAPINKLSLDLLPPYASTLSSPTSLSLASNTRSDSTGSQLSADDASARGLAAGSGSSAATSAASSVSSLHASDDERVAPGHASGGGSSAWRSELGYLGGRGDGKAAGRRSTSDGSSVGMAVARPQLAATTDEGGSHNSSSSSSSSREEETPRGERPPVLGLTSSHAGAADAIASNDLASFRAPSYFPYSLDETVSPRTEMPPPILAPASSTTGPAAAPPASAASPPAHDEQFAPSSLPSPKGQAPPPPSAFRSPSFPPPSRPPAPLAAARSHTHHGPHSSVSTTNSTAPSSRAGSDSWRSSVFSTASSSSASSFSTTASGSSCSVSTPVLPRPWLASDQLLGKSPMTDIRDEDALLVETTDESYVVVACLPGFSLDCITLATKSRRTLHIVADRWERENSAHFERKVTFGADADLAKIRAQFDGSMLRVTVSRRPAPSAGSSAQSFTSLGSDHHAGVSQHRSSLPAAGGQTSPWGTGSESWAPARPASTRSSAPGLLDAVGREVSQQHQHGTKADGPSPAGTVRARSPDAAAHVLAQTGAGSLDELLARAHARDGGHYT